MTSISAILEDLSRRFRSLSDTPNLNAQVLMARTINRSRAWLAAHIDTQLDVHTTTALEKSAQRLERGEPLPYVLGEWEFFRLPFYVTPDVLIPRPETELLVERAISWLKQRLALTHPLSVLDVGTGSGCIAISLAVNVPEVRIAATDISPAALEVAQRNADKLLVARRITFLEADLFPGEDHGPQTMDRDPSFGSQYSPPYDLIAANLPYIPTKTLQSLPVYGREPTLALDGGMDGLNIIRRLLAKAPDMLAPGGLILLEIEASEGPAVLSMAHASFNQAEIQLHQDLAGKDRLVEIQILTTKESE